MNNIKPLSWELTDYMSCGVWSMFQNNKVAKIANIIEIKNNPSNNTVLGKFSTTLPSAQYIVAYSESSDTKYILQINSDGNIFAPLGILNGVYWIDSMFLVN